MELQSTFLQDVIEGLRSSPKKLSSKYFYDDNGDKLFHYIMNQPEYYLTCAEHGILQTSSEAIFSHIDTSNGIRIIEPGAGDGFKTRLLIQNLLARDVKCIYNPIDISANVLDILCGSMRKIYPQLPCEPIVGDYFNLGSKITDDGLPHLMLFLGSNLGNYNTIEAKEILHKFSSILNQGDYFLLGVDLAKDPNRILAAYNDASGYTAQFNYNLLTRINNELDADFKIENFLHYPVYNPVEQQAESYLLSKISQTVTINNGEYQFQFNPWEAIHTEISRKFTVENIHNLAIETGFNHVANFFDFNKDFCCSLWKKVDV